ncbi:hypothetical protein DP091_06975 [Paenibacillus sp. MDMC362]|nr:hypothetical protein DP091_06975 [Paenibacillus sp. MDMC362]
MKPHNHDGKDCRNFIPQSPDNKQNRRYRMLSVSIIVTTILFSTVQPHASLAAAGQADVSNSANTLSLTGTPYTADHHISGVSGVSQNKAAARVPGSLMDFAEETVAQLSAHAPFTTWDEATLEFTPLGPGTHGWLVTISDEGLPQGYMIISAGVDGGYILIEYGIGSTLPYSQGPLKERLAAEGLVKAGGSLPQGSIVRKLYDVSPVWQIQLPGKKPVYFNALSSEALPDEPQQTHSTTKLVSASLPVAAKGLVTSSRSNHWFAGTPSIATGDSMDPYDNLLWLTTDNLTARSSADLRNLLKEHSTLIFKSAIGNAAYGAPFNLTGWHRWSSENQENPAALYVSVPLRNTDTLRFLPASRLIGQGHFYAQPE